MSPKTIIEWRENPDAEPDIDKRAIERYIDRILKDPTDVDIETFVIIEHCNTWFEEYKKILSAKRAMASSSSQPGDNKL